MKTVFIAICVLGAAFLSGCQKQQTDEQRRAEIDRQVQERLAQEHQQQQAQQLDQREADLKAREQELNAREEAPTATPRVERRVTSREENEPAGSYSMFYTRLEPYGDWIETDNYGYVFHPREAASTSWRPYTNGRWIYTDAGWTWIADEPFGWATYHYGRWTRLRGIGWVWVPGNEWAAAWVSWRKGGEYVGWAPLPPEAHFDRRTGIRNWSDSYYEVGPDQYVFVPTQQFGEERIERAIVPQQRNVTIVNQTTNVTNITYNNTIIVNQGPSYDELRAQSQRPIERLRLERQANVQTENPRAVVRGEVVEIPAPLIEGRAVGRPPTVKQTIAHAAVDLGWAAISNQHDAEQARTKIKSEATPPPNAPPKQFVKGAETAPPAASTAETSPAGAATATASISSAPSATPRFIRTPMPRVTAPPSATPSASMTPSPTIAPIQSTTPTPTATPAESRPRVTPVPLPTTAITPTTAPEAQPTKAPRDPNFGPASAATPSPSLTTTEQPFESRGHKGRERRGQEAFSPAPTSAPSSTVFAPQAVPNPSAGESPANAEDGKHRGGKKHQRENQPPESATATPSPSQ